MTPGTNSPLQKTKITLLCPTVTSPSSSNSSSEVSTRWEYVDINQTNFTADLPGDVVQLSLQVKTVRGMYTMNRDAWGGHSQHFRKWGTQITPTPSTRKQVEKFRHQWNQYTKGTPFGGRPQGRKISTPRPNLHHNRMVEKSRERKNLPWLFREVMAPSASFAPAPTWSPVAGPLASMAQLSHGMLPLSSPGKSTTPSSEGVGEARCAKMKDEPVEPKESPLPSTSRGPQVSPISSCEDIPALMSSTEAPPEGPLDLSYQESQEEIRKIKELRKIKEETLRVAKNLEEEKKLQGQLLEMDIKIEKLESISPEQFRSMGNIMPPPQPKEEKVVRFSEPPTSPRSEEEMEVELHNPAPQAAQSPPQEPQVEVVDSGAYSSEEEDVKETRRTSWIKRREAAHRKKLCIRLVRNKVGPNSLEVYQPKTPVTPPNPLFPGKPAAKEEEAELTYTIED